VLETCIVTCDSHRLARNSEVAAHLAQWTADGLPEMRALGLSEMFWINMQAHYDAQVARDHIRTELASIERIA
jgi:plasmid maintenance system antidote protein VapI